VDYQDIRTLIKAARRAQARIVEFNWYFHNEDLRAFRRAVYEWGKHVPGRYRLFDSRVLAAIKDALNGTDTPFVLSEPARVADDNCAAVCVSVNDYFQLSGHATFPVLMGYGAPAWTGP
jgi:hypothetical protein